MKCDVVIIGAGAAGLMCAMTAARAGRRVTVLEHAHRPGRKILMSGGGRCNFTNMYAEPANYLSENPHFCKSALARYTQWDFIEMVERHDIAYHEKELGQLFCDDSSKLILQMLLDECEAAGVNLVLNCRIDSVDHSGAGFSLQTSLGSVTATAVVLASGGLSIPKMGATGFSFETAQAFGHEIIPTRAGLVPFTLSGRPLEEWADLSGLSAEVSLSTSKRSFRGGLLLTHRGLSGPSVLQLSSYWNPGESIAINWLPDLDAAEALVAAKRAEPKLDLMSWLARSLSRRLAQRCAELMGASGSLTDTRDEVLRQYGERLNQWSILPSGTEGYRTAEVTLGGVSTDGLSSSTMESRLVPGLYIIGEAVDVTGHLGGFNFQWAWASGHAAGQALG